MNFNVRELTDGPKCLVGVIELMFNIKVWKKSYFVIIVALLVQLLLVGAPLGQNLQPNTTRSGALWKCQLSTALKDCEQIVTDGKRMEAIFNIIPYNTDQIRTISSNLGSIKNNLSNSFLCFFCLLGTLDYYSE
ncbi:unnamed protein product [Leptidea sinapis]|uniref:Uncharacterized protein n=1 Tax=Leptidea sinapis TaxID=189913 RepID=A0A5E4Q1N2_9NEOP|nr:unnamed protein product [Leptidea sinapis]